MALCSLDSKWASEKGPKELGHIKPPVVTPFTQQLSDSLGCHRGTSAGACWTFVTWKLFKHIQNVFNETHNLWRAYWVQGRILSTPGCYSEQNGPIHKWQWGQWYSSNRDTTSHSAGAGPNVLIFWAEMRTGSEYVKAGGSLKGVECCREERRDGVERLGPRAQRFGLYLRGMFYYCFESITHFLNLYSHCISQIVITPSISPSTPLCTVWGYHYHPSQVHAPYTSSPKFQPQDWRRLFQ